MTRSRILILSLAVLLIPGVALANTMAGPGGASAWTIYAFANGNVLKGILTSASALIKNQEFRHLLEFLATVGLLGTIISVGLFTGDSRKIAGTFLGATFFLTAGIGTTTNVVIEDTVSGYVTAVPDVPILVALPEAIVSTAGHELAQLMDTFYSVPGDLTVTGGNAFNIASALTQASTRVQITDPLLRATIAAFAQNCIVPAIASGRLSSYQLTTSTQLWGNGGTLGGVNPAPLTPVYTDTQPQGVIQPCTAAGAPTGITAVATNTNPSITTPGAYEYISQYIQIAAPQWFSQSAGAWAGTAAYSWLSSTLTSAQSYLFGGALTQSTGETIQQSAAINVLSPALNAAAIASGQSRSVAALAVAQGENSQISSWATAVDLFRDLSGYIYSVLQAFLVAMTPILLAAAFIPGTGWTMVKSYVQITVWLALWLPVLGIINFIVTLYAQGQLGGALGGAGGYSMQSMALVDSLTSHLVLAAGFLATLTPLITWALVKGSFAFTEFLADGLGGRMANLAGSIAATGNISLGNQSFDNTSMNQRMLASTTIAGTAAPQVQALAGGAQFNDGVGGAVVRTPAGVISRGASATQSASIARSESISRSASARASTELSSSFSAATQASRGLSDTLSENSNAGRSVGASQTSQLKQDANRLVDTALKNQTINAAQAAKAKAEIANVGVSDGGGGGGGGLGAVLSMISGGIKQQTDTKNSIGTKFDTSSGGSKDVKAGEGASLSDNAQLAQDASRVFANLQQISEKAGSSASQGFKRAAGTAQSASVDYTKAETARREAQDTASLNGSFAAASLQQADGDFKQLGRQAYGGVNGDGRPPKVGEAGQREAALKAQVTPKVGNTLTTDGRATQNAGAGGAGAAAGSTDQAQPTVAEANHKLSHFNALRQATQEKLQAAQGAADSASDKTSAAANSTVSNTAKAANRGYDSNQTQARIGSDQVQGTTNSILPKITSPSGAEGGGTAASTAGGVAVGKTVAAVVVARKMAAAKLAEQATKDAAKTVLKDAGDASAATAGEGAATAAGGPTAVAGEALADTGATTGLSLLTTGAAYTGAGAVGIAIGGAAGYYAYQKIPAVAAADDWVYRQFGEKSAQPYDRYTPSVIGVIPSSDDLERRFNNATK